MKPWITRISLLFLLCFLTACNKDSSSLEKPLTKEQTNIVPIAMQEDDYEAIVEEKNNSINLLPLDITSPNASELGITFSEPKYKKFSANGEITIAGKIDKIDDLKSHYIWINIQAEKVGVAGKEQNYFVPINDGEFNQTVHFFNGEGTYKIKVQVPSTERENYYYDTANFEVININPERIRDVTYTPLGLEAGLGLDTKVSYVVAEDGVFTLNGEILQATGYQDIMVRLTKDGKIWNKVIPVKNGTFTTKIPLLYGQGLHTLEVMIPDSDKENYYKTATDLLIENTSIEEMEPIHYSSLYTERGVNLLEPIYASSVSEHKFHIKGFIDPEALLSAETNHLYVQTKKGEDLALEVIPINNYSFDHFFYLRFGPGKYEISISVPEITSTKNNFFRYYEVAKFEMLSTIEQDKRDILPSRGVESDSPQIIELANNLIKDKISERDKTKAIYDFVANNISYDVTKFQNEDFNWDDSALKTLELKTGVCQDYAYLTIALLRAVNIEARFVEGYTTDRHAWVEARVDGRWLTMDPTWGAGYIKENKFIASYSEDYFDPADEDFNKTHTRNGIVY